MTGVKYIAFILWAGLLFWLPYRHTDFWKRFRNDGGNPRFTRQTSPLTGRHVVVALLIFFAGMVFLFLSLI